MKLITHSGIGHADDLFAYSVLSTIYPDNELIRTRDMNVIFSEDENKIVFDVGMKYDPTNDIYDHHQNEKQFRDDGIPYSSFGLIWGEFGKIYLKAIGISSSVLGSVWDYVDQELVREIDIGDNGVDTPITKFLTYKSNYSRMIGYMFAEGTDEEFIVAAASTKLVLKNFCISSEKRILDILIADNVFKTYDDNGIIILDQETSATTHIAKNKSVKYIISPRKDQWQVYAVSIDPKSFELRKPLLKSAAGLTDQELVDATGIENLTFCHSGRFLAMGNTKESVLELAKQSLKE